MKNSTLARKPSNDMKKDSGLYMPGKPVKQGTDVESMAYNGQAGTGVNRAKNPYAKNQWSGHSNDGRDVNFGLMESQRKGNASSAPLMSNKPVNKDAHKLTIATAQQGTNIGSGFKCPTYGNPDAINVGMK